MSFYVYETQYGPKKRGGGMREIKLRAWDIKGNQYWGATEGDWKIEFHDGHSPQLFILDYECEHGSWIEIEDVVFEEFTGLTDKNGREICEGDILFSISAMQKETGRVVFDGGAFCLVILSSRTTGFGSKYFLSTCEELEVVGNIHENPELLEVTG